MTDPTTRAERRTQSRRPGRTAAVVGAGCVAIAAVVVAILLVTGGSDDGGNASSTRRVADTKISLTKGEVTADSAGPPVAVPAELADHVVTLVGDYIETATVKPLRSGEPVGDLSGVFSAPALARVNGLDRPAFVDDGIPKVTGDLNVVAQPVAITGLGDQDGHLVALTAAIGIDVTSQKQGKVAPLHITRTGYFVLTPDATGTWTVSAYKIVAGRGGDGIDTTTTTVATTGAGR
jgi:hypothetical protein